MQPQTFADHVESINGRHYLVWSNSRETLVVRATPDGQPAGVGIDIVASEPGGTLADMGRRHVRYMDRARQGAYD